MHGAWKSAWALLIAGIQARACENRDADIITTLLSLGYTVSGCDDAQIMLFCQHDSFGPVVQASCPVTCGSCCLDDDLGLASAVASVSMALVGVTVPGLSCSTVSCAGEIVPFFCPKTCNGCQDVRSQNFSWRFYDSVDLRSAIIRYGPTVAPWKQSPRAPPKN